MVGTSSSEGQNFGKARGITHLLRAYNPRSIFQRAGDLAGIATDEVCIGLSSVAKALVILLSDGTYRKERENIFFTDRPEEAPPCLETKQSSMLFF
jgi:hypothetical protein